MARQFDSEDEREVAELREKKTNLLASQENGRTRNYPKLPRTAGLRTLSEMTTKLTAAGIDPTRIQERAQLLAKVAGAKRKRHERMDVDEVRDGGQGEEADWMDVDDEEGARGNGTPKKKRKSLSGTAVAVKKHVPASNRQVAGMRDAAVCIALFLFGRCCCLLFFCFYSKFLKQFNYGIYHNAIAIAWQKPARRIALFEQKWWAFYVLLVGCKLSLAL